MKKKTKNAFLTAFIAAFIGTAITTYLTTRSSNPAPQTAAPITPSNITRIGTNEGAVTRTAPARWMAFLIGYNREWPASAAAVRAALRAAADISQLEPAGEPPTPLPTNIFTFTAEDGTERTLAIAEAPIAGKHTVVIDGSVAVRAPAALVEQLLPGPAAWRDTSLFPNAGPDVTRILIQQPGTQTDPAREIDLVKTAGRWLIVSPVLARGNEDVARNAIARLAGAEITRFLDEQPADLTTGLDEPSFTITIEAGDYKRGVSFGAEADAAGQQRFALSGRATHIADVSLLNELRLDPAAYTDRRPSAVTPADVHAVRVDDARAERTLTGWTDPPFNPAAILQTLTTNPDSTVAFTEPAGWTQLAEITLEDLAKEPIEVITIGEDEAGALHARTQLPGGGPVYYSLPPSFRAALQ